MRKTVTLAAGALALVVAPLAAQAQGATAKPAGAQGAAAKPAAAPGATGKAEASGEAPKMTPEQLKNFQRGILIMRQFTGAFTSDQISTQVKGRLIACLYANTLEKISIAAGQVLASTPTLDENKPADVWHAAAGVCGIVFKKINADAATTPAAPAPGATKAPTGR